MATLSEINSGLLGKITGGVDGGAIIGAIGWLFVAIIAIGITAFFAVRHYEKKKFNRIIKAHTIINGFFQLTYSDIAKPIKLGKGGFEILYLKKLKTWKIGHNARTGANEYTYFILPDGYWYPGKLSGDLKHMDENGGLIQVISTSPNMRSQYASLEKQIESVLGEKKSFWDKYGGWIFSIGFLVITGLFAWLSWKEWSQGMGSFTGVVEKMDLLADRLNRLAVNLDSSQASGLVPAP